MEFSTFLSDILATLVGGIILTLIFFLLKEKLFSLPSINGKWFLETKTAKTDYTPYKNMVLRYMIILWSEGNTIKGSSEKIYENSSEGIKEYIGKDRTLSKIEGYIEKKYFTKDKIYLHFIEKGKIRKSTTFYDLKVYSNCFEISAIIGTFSSMIANQNGEATIKREKF